MRGAPCLTRPRSCSVMRTPSRVPCDQIEPRSSANSYRAFSMPQNERSIILEGRERQYNIAKQRFRAFAKERIFWARRYGSLERRPPFEAPSPQPAAMSEYSTPTPTKAVLAALRALQAKVARLEDSYADAVSRGRASPTKPNKIDRS